DGQDGEYRDLVNSFVEWSARNHLLLNVTKEMVVDFRRKTSTISPFTIMGQNGELVDTCKYLGVLLDNKLDWKARGCVQEGDEQTLLLEKAQIFQCVLQDLHSPGLLQIIQQLVRDQWASLCCAVCAVLMLEYSRMVPADFAVGLEVE
ncbi:hypothetical protein NFI96_019650, partial [Prochilodus magdalenae]